MQVATGSGDGTARIWDLGSGAQQGIFSGHAGRVLAVAITPDGRRVVTGGDDATVRIWDLGSGAQQGIFSGHAGRVLAVAITPDGRRVVTGGDDATIRIWDLGSGAQQGIVSGHAGRVLALAITPDGRRVVTGGDDATIRIWDLGSGAQQGIVSGRTGRVLALAITPDGRRVVTGGDDATIRVWDLGSGDELPSLIGNIGWVLALAVTPDGTEVVAGGSDGTAGIWRLDTRTNRARLRGHVGFVLGIAVTPDDEEVITVGGGSSARIWNLRSGEARTSLTGHPNWAWTVAVTPDGKEIVTGSLDGVRIWNRRLGTLRSSLTGHSGWVRSVAVTPDGEDLITGGGDGTARIWDITSGAERARLVAGHGDPVWAVAVTPDGEEVITGGGDGVARVWGRRSATQRLSLRGHDGLVLSVAVTPDGEEVITGGFDGTTRIWDRATGEERLRFFDANPVWAVAVTPDGAEVVTCGGNNARIRNRATGEERVILTGHTGPIWAVAIAPNGREIITGGADSTIRVWGRDDGQQVRGSTQSVLEEIVRPLAPEAIVRERIAAAGANRRLDLTGLEIADLPPEIGKLSGTLRHLSLAGNRLTALAPEIGRLSQLQSLWLDSNQLTALLPEIGRLSQLQSLSLDSNQLAALPPEIGGLSQLQELTLRYNRLTVLLPEIGQLSQLQVLRLDCNELKDLPPEIGRLSQLQSLSLDSNQLTALPPEIGQLTALQSLDLTGNQLTVLPAEIAQLSALQKLNVGGNPLGEEVLAAARSGVAELRAFLARVAEEGEALYEAKLILVGEGNVGKSSLLATLRGEPWLEDRDSTHGIEIKELGLRLPTTDVDMVLNGWDFGGQPVYRSTHQLFFSAPALYLVVWYPREGVELNFVDYWIRLIRHRAGHGVRVVVVATHRADRRLARLDEAALRSVHDGIIVGFHHVDSKTGEGIDELTETIRAEAAALPGMGRPYPKSWRDARRALKDVAFPSDMAPDARMAQGGAPSIPGRTPTPYLSYLEFEDVVAGAGLDKSSAASFARNSHELGHLVHYGEDPGLADLVVLRPDWLSRAISQVLEDRATADAKGLVRHEHLAQLWSSPGHPDGQAYPPGVHPMLLRLMERFDISYRVALPATDGSEGSEISLVSQLVPSSPVGLDESWVPEVPAGRIELTQVLEVADDQGRPATAEGLVYQLIVRLHRYSLGRADYRRAVHWAAGMVLDDRFNGAALLKVEGNRLEVRVRAAYPSNFMQQLTEEVRWLLKNYWKGVDGRRKVPCPRGCSGLFDLEHLLESKEKQRPEHPCPVCNEWQNIDALLLGFVRPAAPSVEQVDGLRREIRVLSANVTQGFDKVSGDVASVLSRADEQFRALLRTQDDEAENGPRLFTLHPADVSWRKPGWTTQRFVLTLFCEHSGLPVHVLDGNPTAGVYELEMPRAWVVKAAPVAKLVAGVLSVALPGINALGEIELGDATWTKIKSQVDAAEKSLGSLVGEVAGDLAYDVRQGGRMAGLDPAPALRSPGGVLRELHATLTVRDPSFGGLEKVRDNRRQALWVHARFRELYNPRPPVVGG